MEALYIMIPITLLLSGAALAACVWAIQKGQFDDTETPAYRILNDDDDDGAVFGEPHDSNHRSTSHSSVTLKKNSVLKEDLGKQKQCEVAERISQ